MRPTAVESLNALRAALAEVLVPELTSPFAQDTASTLQMLIESLSAEWDTAAEDLHRDNETLVHLLTNARVIFDSDSNAESATLVRMIDEALTAPEAESLAISALSARNTVLRAALEQALVNIEDRIDYESPTDLAGLRAGIYEHLRDVAGRGWSFWDVASFREYMNRYQTERSHMTS